MLGFPHKDKTHFACICRQCGQLQIKDKSIDPEEYVCGVCSAKDLLVTSMTPSEAEREKNAQRWSLVLVRYFTPEEIENFKKHTYGTET